MIPALIAMFAMQVADPVVGTWRGSSICQVRPSACKDEQAVYHVTGNAGGTGYAFVMNKIVAGVEAPMGELDATFDSRTASLTGVTYDRARRPLTWVFVLRGPHMSGRLTGPDGTVLRRIELDRTP